MNEGRRIEPLGKKRAVNLGELSGGLSRWERKNTVDFGELFNVLAFNVLSNLSKTYAIFIRYKKHRHVEALRVRQDGGKSDAFGIISSIQQLFPLRI